MEDDETEEMTKSPGKLKVLLLYHRTHSVLLSVLINSKSEFFYVTSIISEVFAVNRRYMLVYIDVFTV